MRWTHHEVGQDGPVANELDNRRAAVLVHVQLFVRLERVRQPLSPRRRLANDLSTDLADVGDLKGRAVR